MSESTLYSPPAILLTALAKEDEFRLDLVCPFSTGKIVLRISKMSVLRVSRDIAEEPRARRQRQRSPLNSPRFVFVEMNLFGNPTLAWKYSELLEQIHSIDCLPARIILLKFFFFFFLLERNHS